MASHFISNDYLIRNKQTLNKVSVATPAGFTVPSWRAGKAYEKSQAMDRQKKAAVNHAIIAIDRLQAKKDTPYVHPSQRRRGWMKKAKAA